MTEPGGAALETALAYHRAWTGGDFERAMSYVADDIVCLAPAGRLDGAAAFRGFMGPFTQILTKMASSPLKDDAQTQLSTLENP